MQDPYAFAPRSEVSIGALVNATFGYAASSKLTMNWLRIGTLDVQPPILRHSDVPSVAATDKPRVQDLDPIH